MGAFLECRVEKNFPQVEISEEISKEFKKNNKDKDKTKNIKNSVIKEKRNNRNKKLNKENNEEDDMIIINTDEEKSNTGKEINIKNKTKNNTNNNKNKKINNTIFINNSNVTIGQRKEKKTKEDLNEIKPDFNFNTNEDNLELDEILNNVFNNNKVNSINYHNNRNLFTESDIDYNYNKEYFDNLYTEQSQINLDINPRNENDEKIIKKLNQLKEKINNKNKPQKKNKKDRYKFSFNPVKVQRTISMANKQIKKNIPSYRKNRGFFNSISFNQNDHFSKFKAFNYSHYGFNTNTLGNSFNKSLYSSLMCESVKDHFYDVNSKNNFINNIYEDKYIKYSKETPSIYSMQKSYFNNSSMNQTSSNGFNSQTKTKKYKSLYRVVANKKRKMKPNTKILHNKNSKIKKNLIKFDLKKELENDEKNNNILYHQYRDIIEIILPNNFLEESIVDNRIYDISELNKNKVILNYNKLSKFKTSTILYDGIVYKVSDKKDKGFKLSKRYFQISKNCFRYYNSFENKEGKPLVQFDIRHIKDLQIIENDFLMEYKVDNRDIEMVFCIYLNQNNDFFVFAVNNENLGKSIFDLLSLLKNYYEDKK
jgi:hypothetical protein